MVKSRSRSDDDDEPAPRKRTRRDDDDVGIRTSRGDREPEPAAASGAAITSMIIGISSVVVFTSGCGCACVFPPFAFIPWGVALVLALVSLIMGFIGNQPGSGAFAWSGIICSLLVILAFLVSVALVFIFGVAFLAAAANQPPGPQGPFR